LPSKNYTMNRIAFFKESIKNLKTVGTFTRSSKFLCKGMIKPVDFEKAKVIVEIGAGDGVVTKHILANMRKDAILLSFEVNEKFCKIIQTIDDDRLHVVEDSAEHIKKHLKKNGASHADYIISAVPFVAFPKELALKIVNNCSEVLKPGGLFVQIHYSLMTKKLYESVFGNVDINFVPLNLPPAFVLVSQKN